MTTRHFLILAGLTLLTDCHFSRSSAACDPVPPAIAEQPISAEESLNPLVDLVRAKRENEARLQKALQKPVTIVFEKIPLDEAMKRLGQKAGVPIWINRESLEEESLDGDDLASCNAQGITLHQAFTQILEPIGLDYRIEDEVIKIIAKITAPDRLEVRYYEVADLLKWEKTHRYEPRALSNTLFSTHRPHDWLLDLIEWETSGPWIPLDKTGGTAEVHGTVLAVRHTQSVQNEIPGILKMLRLFIEGKFGRDRSVLLETLMVGNNDLAARRALARRVSLNFNETSLENVAEKLTKKLDVPVVLEKNVLIEEGVNPSDTVTLQIDKITLSSALKLMLEPFSLEAVDSDGRILITTIIAAEEMLHSVAFDVRDLIRSGGIGKDFTFELLWMETSGPWEQVDGTGGRIYEPLPGLLIVRQTLKVQKEVVAALDGLREREKNRKAKGFPPRKVAAPPKPDDVLVEMYNLHQVKKPKQVKQTIYSVVAPETWEAKGGAGSIHIINELMVVKNTAKVHREVHSFMIRLGTTMTKQRIDNIPFGDPYLPMRHPILPDDINAGTPASP